MNHQPFEDWLLNDKTLTPAETRELDLHLRTCPHCTALSATGLALRAAPVIAPAAGFTLRFQQRLIAQKAMERRRKLWGMILFIIGGAGFIVWFSASYLLALFNAPVQWITTFIGYSLFIVTTLQALTEVMTVLLRMASDFIPTYIWLVLSSTLAGLGLLWAISIWQFSRTQQGVSV